jgi:ribosome maturation factor RimP
MVGPRYVLEVSSPGLERPLRWPEHWRRFIGRRARVRAQPLGGRRLVEIVAMPDDEHVTLRPEQGEEITLSLDQISEATLVVDWAAVGKRRGPDSLE